MNLTYRAELTTSYAAVSARLWPKQKRVNIVVIPTKTLTAPVYEREWYGDQNSHVWAWRTANVFAEYCHATADHGDVKPIDGIRIRIEEIALACANHFEISLAEIKSSRRFRKITNARQVAMYLCKELTNRSYPEIGRRMGGRDHTTALHSARVVTKRLETDEMLRADISTIRARLEAK